MLGKYNINEETLDRYYTITTNNIGNVSWVIGKADTRWPDGKKPSFRVEL